ncbi:MAG: type VI secretion system TssO [Ginsengibacter sp.]
MQPTNTSQRTKAFLNFLLLFILSIGIIITTVFFSIEVPFKQNNDLRKQINIVQRDRVFSSNFLTEMSGIIAMLDSVNNTSRPDFLDGQISENINKLSSKVNADSVYDKNLYMSIMQNLVDFQLAKKQLREVTSKADDVNDLKRQNEELRTRLDDSKAQINNLMIQLTQRR